MADAKTVDQQVTLVNTGKNVINSGQIRLMPGGAITLPESKISEGLKRLLAMPGSGLQRKAE
jgi:hypothetical protein